MDFDGVREIVRSFDRKNFDVKLAAESGVAVFSSMDPVFLRNNDVIVEVSHDGFCGITGVSVYGNATYLYGAGYCRVIGEMERVTSRGPVAYLSVRGHSSQKGYVFRQDSEPFKSEIFNSMDNVRRLQGHMLEFMDRYVPAKPKVFVKPKVSDGYGRSINPKVSSGPRKKYTIHTKNDGFHGRRDDHYHTVVEYGGEYMTVEELICQFGNEKDGRSGSRSGMSWGEYAKKINGLTGFHLSPEAIKMRFYKICDSKSMSA